MAKKRPFQLLKKEPKAGEIVRLASSSPFLPGGLYRVEGREGSLLHLSAGEIGLGTQIGSVRVLARDLPEPHSWLPHEIAVLRALVEMCDCRDCAENLKKKEAQLAELGIADNGGEVMLH